jgi:hypothetical protein
LGVFAFSPEFSALVFFRLVNFDFVFLRYFYVLNSLPRSTAAPPFQNVHLGGVFQRIKGALTVNPQKSRLDLAGS